MNALPIANYLICQSPESDQCTQKMKITNLLGHMLYALAQISIETFQPSALKAARLTQQLMEDIFGIRKIFEPPHIRHGQRFATRWISRGCLQGGFVNEQPSFLHSHGNNTDNRQCLSSLTQFQRFSNFIKTLRHRSALCVPMHEEQIAGIQLYALVDALRQFFGRIREPSQIGKFRLDGSAFPVLAQQPGENGYERPIGRAITHQCKAQSLHSTPDSWAKKKQLLHIISIDYPPLLSCFLS